MSRRSYLAMALGAAACSRPKSEIHLLTFPESYGHHLSIGQGYYRELGLTVNADYFQSFPKMMEALLAGDGGIATAYYDALLPLIAAGRDVVAFLCLAKRPGSVLASLKHESVSALRGATIGIPGPGSSSHHMLNAVLRKSGIDPGQVSVTGIGVAAGAIAAVEQNKVDAAMLTNLGLSTLRLKHPGVHVLADLRTPQGAKEYLGSEEYPSLCLTARRPWLEANRDPARHFVEAFLKANRWMSQHTPEQIREALPPEARAADAAADVEAIRGMLPTLDTSGQMTEAGAKAVLEVVRASVPAVREAGIDIRKTLLTI